MLYYFFYIYLFLFIFCSAQHDFDYLLQKNNSYYYQDLFKPDRRSYWMHKKEYTNSDFKNKLTLLYDSWLNRATEKMYIKKIPHIIHVIWLGSSVSEKIQKNIDAWKNAFPDWAIMMWNDALVEEFGLINKNLYDTATNYGEKSDIARIEILKRYGGLYIDVDCDIVNVRILQKIHDSCTFYAGLESLGGWVIIGNAVIGSIAEHPLLQSYIDKLAAWQYTAQPFLSLPDLPVWTSTCLRTGPGFFSSVIYDYIQTSQDNICIMPPCFFYPCIKGDTPIFSDVTCIYHRFDSLWLS